MNLVTINNGLGLGKPSGNLVWPGATSFFCVLYVISSHYSKKISKPSITLTKEYFLLWCIANSKPKFDKGLKNYLKSQKEFNSLKFGHFWCNFSQKFLIFQYKFHPVLVVFKVSKTIFSPQVALFYLFRSIFNQFMINFSSIFGYTSAILWSIFSHFLIT